MDSYTCLHDGLAFRSGGYYIQCTKCTAWWVAIADFDTNLDHDRGAGPRSGHIWKHQDAAKSDTSKD